VVERSKTHKYKTSEWRGAARRAARVRGGGARVAAALCARRQDLPLQRRRQSYTIAIAILVAKVSSSIPSYLAKTCPSQQTPIDNDLFNSVVAICPATQHRAHFRRRRPSSRYPRVT